MEGQFRYMVKRDGEMPTLLRIEPDAAEKVYCSWNSGSSGGFDWLYSPELEDIVDHKERFPEYTDITNEEAEKIKHQLDAEYDRIEEEKHVIRVEHSQKVTDKGVVLIDIYTKEEERRWFRAKDLEKLLTEIMGKEHLTIRGFKYCFYDFWGYPKHRIASDEEDIHEICDGAVAIDGSFTDKTMKYRFMYLGKDEKVVVAKCLKKTGINLFSVFDEETNRKASGNPA